MNWVDGAIVVAAAMGAWRGAAGGFGQIGCQWAGALGGILSAYLVGKDVSDALLRRVLMPEWLARPLAVVSLVAGCALGGHFLGLAWARWVRATPWSRWDRWAGALLGLVVATLVCAVLLYVWVEWPGRPFPAAVEGSLLARRLLEALPAVYRRAEGVLAPLR